MARLPVSGQDSGTWGDILNEFMLVEHNPDGTLKAGGSLATKANDIDVVHNSGAETITGTKTFSAPVVVPTPTNSTHATTKAYVDTAAAAGTPDADATTKGKLQLAGDLGGTAASPTVPGLSAKTDKSTLTTKGDIYAATAASTPARLGVGADGQILTASSAAGTGLTWVTPASSNSHTTSTKSGAYVLTTNDEIILANASGGAFALTLPTAVGNTNLYDIKKIDSSANAVTIDTTGGQTIDGGSTAVIQVQYVSVTVASDNSNWFVI